MPLNESDTGGRALLIFHENRARCRLSSKPVKHTCANNEAMSSPLILMTHSGGGLIYPAHAIRPANRLASPRLTHDVKNRRPTAKLSEQFLASSPRCRPAASLHWSNCSGDDRRIIERQRGETAADRPSPTGKGTAIQRIHAQTHTHGSPTSHRVLALSKNRTADRHHTKLTQDGHLS